jgi:glutathione S-transferase
LNAQLSETKFVLGPKLSIADVAIFPFIRQFHMIDESFFGLNQLDALKRWLNGRIESKLFLSVMQKYPVWHDVPSEKS